MLNTIEGMRMKSRYEPILAKLSYEHMSAASFSTKNVYISLFYSLLGG